jgi:Tfp pilus assembly protein PilN
MININLIPKQYLKRSGGFNLGKHGAYTMAAVGGIVLMLGAVTMYQVHQMRELNGQMEIARSRTLQLQKDIQMVDALIDIKAKITDRMDAVERLDRYRSAWVRILEDLSKNIPDFVWLSSFSEVKPQTPAAAQKTAVVTPGKAQPASQPKQDATVAGSSGYAEITVKPAEIEGFTFTLNALASFMIKMMRSNYFDDIDLVYTKEIAFGRQKAYNFKLSCTVHYLSDEEVEKLAMQTLDSMVNDIPMEEISN